MSGPIVLRPFFACCCAPDCGQYYKQRSLDNDKNNENVLAKNFVGRPKKIVASSQQVKGLFEGLGVEHAAFRLGRTMD